MNKRTISHIEGAEIGPVIRYILEQHDCTIHEAADVITFPHGTIEEELIPRMPFTERTTLTLPDGTVIYKMYNRISFKPITTLCVTKEVYENALLHNKGKLLAFYSIVNLYEFLFSI